MAREGPRTETYDIGTYEEEREFEGKILSGFLIEAAAF